MSAKHHFFRGAIALAVNGVPIFNPIKNDGKTDTLLAGARRPGRTTTVRAPSGLALFGCPTVQGALGDGKGDIPRALDAQRNGAAFVIKLIAWV